MDTILHQAADRHALRRQLRMPCQVVCEHGFTLLARECVDEAMTRAYERWAHVGAMDRPAGWVYRVAVNQARNRGRRRRTERDRRPPPVAPVPGADTMADPAVAAAVALLPLDQRAVVVLRFYLDWSTEEVATALGIAEGTVKSRLHRALRRLETSLREST